MQWRAGGERWHSSGDAALGRQQEQGKWRAGCGMARRGWWWAWPRLRARDAAGTAVAGELGRRPWPLLRVAQGTSEEEATSLE